MGDYVVDFVCHRSRLIVEVDGGVHAMDVVAQRDAERDLWLAGRGYRVLRLTNRDVIANVEAAVRRIIAAACPRTPTPHPLPARGRGE
jgi:very-short-patch-repair endonuclease